MAHRHRALMRLLEVGTGVATEVLVDEPESTAGAAIVLMPSSQRDSRDFDDLARRLAAQGHRVLRPQPRGMGARGSPPGMTLHSLAGDAASTIASCAGGPAIVVGHAFGHFVARVTDLDHPQHVRGVVVLAGAARSSPPGLSRALDIAVDSAQPCSQRLASSQHSFFALGTDPTTWFDGWHPHTRAAYRAVAATPAKDSRWPPSHAPISSLQGADDPWRPPSTQDELRDAFGEAKVSVERVAGASHALVPEQPAAAADAIARWARSL